MTQRSDINDSHTLWLEDDIEYRKEFGAENAKLEMAEAFANARELVGFTQAALAELAGTSQAYIAKLESGEANPTIGNIGKLFACLWLKPDIGFRPMERFESIESVVIHMKATESAVEFSTRDNSPYSVRIRG